MTRVHICAPQGFRFQRTGTCPDCKQRTRFIGISYEWYGPDQWCLKCGRRWSDGEWMPLPFVRDSRRVNLEQGKRAYRHAAVGCPVVFP